MSWYTYGSQIFSVFLLVFLSLHLYLYLNQNNKQSIAETKQRQCLRWEYGSQTFLVAKSQSKPDRGTTPLHWSITRELANFDIVFLLLEGDISMWLFPCLSLMLSFKHFDFWIVCLNISLLYSDLVLLKVSIRNSEPKTKTFQSSAMKAKRGDLCEWQIRSVLFL